MLATIAPNFVDWCILVVVIAAAVNGFRRKLSGELASLTGSIIALLVGVRVCGPFGRLIHAHTLLSRPSAYALAFILTIVGCFVLMMALYLFFRNIIQIVVKGRKTELVGGVLAGATKAVALCAIVVQCIALWPHDYLNRSFCKNSLFGSALAKAMPHLRETAAFLEEKMNKAAE